ncbi:MAG: DUF2235 domain-containing protein [Methylococcales bacterium]
MSKNIILCSDGTGNKGGYGKDTNVYKLYKSVDIHHPDYPQTTYYDNGVGTQSNKYIRALTEAFGFGFQANVCDLYEFLVRNYEPGDAIYIFGFSRGAATVRAFTGLLYACGLVNRYDNQAQEKSSDVLRDDIALAIKAYEKINKNHQPANDFKATKALHDDQYVPNGVLPIKFIGVWDTVSALGFPRDWSIAFDWIFGLLDTVTDQIWPHNFYDYELNTTIENAYQALAIDDERKTFQPMVWDESANGFSGVVEQVWFSGAHSNIGGGYPRTGLSDVSMDWMLVRAVQHGLVMKTDVETNFKTDADIHDQLYDSRDGFGLYYRYEPRDIDALIHTNEGTSKLKTNVKVHNTVMQRIKQETAGYAPGYLPYEFDVVETPLQAPVTPMQANQEKNAWQTARNQIASYVNQRQWLYRILVEFTLMVILVSGWLWMTTDIVSPEDTSSNFINRFFDHVSDVFQYVLPTYFDNFIHYVIRLYSWVFVVIIVAMYGLFKLRKHITYKLRKACEKLGYLLLKNN